MSNEMTAWLRYWGLNWKRLNANRRIAEVGKMLAYYSEHRPYNPPLKKKYRNP